MDLQAILDQKIKQMPPGPYVDGLRAVASHIGAAIRHLTRGQKELDETLFTDVIFRCNQAFEGSIKEAYRVLAGKDPEKTTPSEIEQYLAVGNVLKKKVLDQFATYRKEWRNPSTHDYTLSFDEDEALVAIASVTVFAIVLCDQIDGKMAFNAAAIAIAEPVSRVEQSASLLELVTNKILSFARAHTDSAAGMETRSNAYARLEGALAGYLSSELSQVPDIIIHQNRKFAVSEADIVAERGSEKIVVEVKLAATGARTKQAAHDIVTSASTYLLEPDVSGVVALIYSTVGRDYAVTPGAGLRGDKIRIVSSHPGRPPSA